MRQAVVSVIAVVVLVISLVIPMNLANNQPAYAGKNDNCIVKISGPVQVIVCDGKVTQQVPIPTIRITVPGSPGKTVTIRPPQATQTVRPPAQTITVPGPTKTITKTGQGHTSFRTITTSPEHITTVKTKTITVSPSGQDGTTGGTVVTDVPPDGGRAMWFAGPVRVVGISTLTLMFILGLILFGTWLGYILGRKDADRENANFLRALSDQLLVRGKHR